MNFLDLEFLVTGSKPYRYPLEKNGHGRNRGPVNERRAMPTLLNDTEKLVPGGKEHRVPSSGRKQFHLRDAL